MVLRTERLRMGQALSIGARGGGIFSRTKYADKGLGVKFDHVVGDHEQTTRAKALNNSMEGRGRQQTPGGSNACPNISSALRRLAIGVLLTR